MIALFFPIRKAYEAFVLSIGAMGHSRLNYFCTWKVLFDLKWLILQYSSLLFTTISFLFFPHRIIVDLLKMNVAPQAVFQTLKAMCAGQRVAENGGGGGDASTGPQTTSIPAAPAEPRGWCLRCRHVVDTAVKRNNISFLLILGVSTDDMGEKKRSGDREQRRICCVRVCMCSKIKPLLSPILF